VCTNRLGVETKRSRSTWPFSFCSLFFLTLFSGRSFGLFSLDKTIDDFDKAGILKLTIGFKRKGYFLLKEFQTFFIIK
jgi:hypothetical protein